MLFYRNDRRLRTFHCATYGQCLHESIRRPTLSMGNCDKLTKCQSTWLFSLLAKDCVFSIALSILHSLYVQPFIRSVIFGLLDMHVIDGCFFFQHLTHKQDKSGRTGCISLRGQEEIVINRTRI